jgi:hypothetical protein
MKGWALNLIALVSSTSAWCGALPPHVDKNSFPLVDIKAKRISISSNCIKKNGSLHCAAYAALGKASLEGLAHYLEGGADPGAVICRQQFHAQLVFTVDLKRNENTLCEFSDGSYVDTGSLDGYARRNAQK